MESGQPKRKKQRTEKETGMEKVEADDEKEIAKKGITPTTPTKRKVMREEREKNPPKRRRQNADMRKYISCKKWRTDQQKLEGVEEKERTADKLLGMGSSVDTTSSSVNVNIKEIAKSLIET